MAREQPSAERILAEKGPPPRHGLAPAVLSRGLEHVPKHVSSGLVRAQQLLRPLRLLERILDYCVRMVLAATMR